MRARSTRVRRWTTAVFAGLLAVGLSSIGQADACEVNPTCAGFDFGVKFESPGGTYVIDEHGLSMTLTVGTFDDTLGDPREPNPRNAVLSFTVSGDVTHGQIIVKGGPGANIYSFDASTPLHAPVNTHNGKWPTISHVQICWDEPEAPQTGALAVTKAVEGDGAPTGLDFEVCITGPGGAPVCQDIGDGETATFDQLEPGAYTVSETDPGTNWTVTGTGDVTVTAGQIATVTVTNTWDEPQEPEQGRIEVTKAVEGEGAPADQVFVLCVTGPQPDGAESCQKALAGDVVAFDGLEPGTYTVSETDPGTKWTVTGTGDVSVTADQTTTVTVTNTWDEPDVPEEPEYGTLAVTKAVEGDGAPTGLDFEVCITGPGGTPVCQDIGDGETAAFDQLEPGTYTVSETDPGTNWTVTGTGDVTVTADQTTTVTVTNTWEQQEQLAPGGGTVTPTTQPQGGSLPTTGSAGRLTLSAIAAGLLLSGAALLRSSRRPDRVIG